MSARDGIPYDNNDDDDDDEEYVFVQASGAGAAPRDAARTPSSPDTVRDIMDRAWRLTTVVQDGILSAVGSMRKVFDSTREVRQDLYEILEAVAFAPPPLASAGECYYY